MTSCLVLKIVVAVDLRISFQACMKFSECSLSMSLSMLELGTNWKQPVCMACVGIPANRSTNKHSNKHLFQYWCNEGCRIPSQTDSMLDCAQEQGVSNATLRWIVAQHLEKLRVCEVYKACEYCKVKRYAIECTGTPRFNEPPDSERPSSRMDILCHIPISWHTSQLDTMNKAPITNETNKMPLSQLCLL